MAIRCPGCGKDNEDGARFCKACGKPMAGAQPPPPVAETPSPVAAPAPAVPLPGYPAPSYAVVKPRSKKLSIILGLAALTVVAIVVVVLVITLSGGGGVAGKYKRTGSDEILELKADGTFVIEGSIPFDGTYEVNGSILTLHMEVFGYTTDMKATIKDGRISSDYGGEVYVKQ